MIGANDTPTTTRPDLMQHFDALDVALREVATLWRVLFILDASAYTDETVGDFARMGERLSRQAKDELERLRETWRQGRRASQEV